MKTKETIFMAFETVETSILFDLPTHCLFPVKKGILFLEKANQELLASGKNEEITCFLYESAEQSLPTCEGQIQLPMTNEPMSEYLRRTFQSVAQESEEANAFFLAFERSLLKKRNEMPPPKKKQKPSFSEGGRPPEREPPFSHKIRGGRLFFFLLMAIVLLGIGVWVGKNADVFLPATDETQERVVLEHQLQSQGKRDTFSRYFLTNYYTGTTEKEQVQEKVRRFVSEELLDQISGQEAQLKSAFPWETKGQKESWLVSYIVVLQTGKETVTTKKVTFQLKEKQEKLFVTTIPKEEPFEINQ